MTTTAPFDTRTETPSPTPIGPITPSTVEHFLLTSFGDLVHDFLRDVERLLLTAPERHVVDTWLPGIGTTAGRLAYGGDIVVAGGDQEQIETLLHRQYPAATVHRGEVATRDAALRGRCDVVVMIEQLSGGTISFGVPEARQLLHPSGAVLVVEPVSRNVTHLLGCGGLRDVAVVGATAHHYAAVGRSPRAAGDVRLS